MNKNNFPEYAMQQAVWCISDGNPIAAISDDDEKSILPLREKVAAIKGEDVPWYSVTYENGTRELFSGKHATVSGQIEYYISTNSEVEVGVFNEYGCRMVVLSAGLQDPDMYTHHFSIEVKGWAKGKYFVRVMVEGRRTNEKSFEL